MIIVGLENRWFRVWQIGTTQAHWSWMTGGFPLHMIIFVGHTWYPILDRHSHVSLHTSSVTINLRITEQSPSIRINTISSIYHQQPLFYDGVKQAEGSPMFSPPLCFRWLASLLWAWTSHPQMAIANQIRVPNDPDNCSCLVGGYPFGGWYTLEN